MILSGVLPKGRSLVPGCGRGYDAIAFGKSGYDSLGLDLSPTGVGQANALLAEQRDQPSGKVTTMYTDTLCIWYTKYICSTMEWVGACAGFPVVRSVAFASQTQTPSLQPVFPPPRMNGGGGLS